MSGHGKGRVKSIPKADRGIGKRVSQIVLKMSGKFAQSGFGKSGFSFEAGGRTFRPVVCHSTSGTLRSILAIFFLLRRSRGALRRQENIHVRCFQKYVRYFTKQLKTLVSRLLTTVSKITRDVRLKFRLGIGQ